MSVDKRDTIKKGKLVVIEYQDEVARKRLEYVAEKYKLSRLSVYVVPEDDTGRSAEIMNEFLQTDPALEVINFLEAKIEAPKTKEYSTELPVNREQAKEILESWGYRVGEGKQHFKGVGGVDYSLEIEQAEGGTTKVNIVLSSYSTKAISNVIRDLKVKEWDFKH